MAASDAQLYATKWEAFTRLKTTEDTLAQEGTFLRRWLLMPYVAFIVPIDDERAAAQLIAWQRELHPWLQYEPQPLDRLHITLHYAGALRRNWLRVLPYTWMRKSLPPLAQRVRPALADCEQFSVRLGPLNAFPNALIAEVQDKSGCLRALRLKLRRALPIQARPPSAWSYLPHVTLGFWGKQPVPPLVEALAPFRTVEPVRIVVRRVKFTIYEREMIPPVTDLLTTARETVVAEYVLKERRS